MTGGSAFSSGSRMVDLLTGHGLVLATRNPHKVRELERLLEPRGIRVFALPSGAPEVPETENTFTGNALLKARSAARYLARANDLPDGVSREAVAMADDSGIVVDALDGRPGVQSAYYGGPGLDDEGRLQLMLQEMKDVPEERRTARYVCVLALCFGSGPDGPEERIFEGRCEGRIALAKSGDGGFGYDPVFMDPELGQTFAEISPAAKDERSHRGRALGLFLDAL